MRKRSKNGFTIVELVVVIAVIGILTAILIPLFVNLTGKAQERDNQSFVRNINTQLAINEADKGFKNSVMEDSIKLAQSMGFDVTKITPYNNNDIVWDSVHDRFAIVKSDYDQEGKQNKEHVVYADASFDVKTPLYQLWKVYAEYPNPDETKQTYSIYAKEATAWDNKDITNLQVGFDAGKNTKIKSIHYVGSEDSQSQDVVIRTNSASTNIALNPYVDSTDATKGDHISFYGKAGQITGPKDEDGNYTGFTVAFNSIAINGKVVGLKVASGHIDLTNAIVEEGDEIVILATTTDVKVSNPNKVPAHAHATSESNASAMNDPADSTKKSVGITWDYDGNVAQNQIDDIHHHITEEQAAEAGESLGTGPVDGGEWNYVEAVEEVVYAALNEEVSENASYVARIGATGYESFLAALNTAVTNETATITMLKDTSFTLGRRYDITNTNITIDLNGHVLTHDGESRASSYLLRPNTDSTLTLTDTSGSGTGAFVNAQSANVLSVQDNAVVNISNIRVSSAGVPLTASSSGKLNINNTTITTTSNYSAGISISGTSELNIINSVIVGGPALQINTTGVVLVDHCNLTGFYTSIVTVQNSSSAEHGMRISNSTLNVREGAKLQVGLSLQSNAKTIELDNCTIDMANSTHTEQYAIRITSEGVSTVNANGLEVKNVTGYAICMDMDGYGTAVFANSSFNTTKQTVEMDHAGGSVTFNSGCVISTEESDIYYTANGSMTTVNPGVTLNVNPGTSDYKYTINGKAQDNGNGTWTIVAND